MTDGNGEVVPFRPSRVGRIRPARVDWDAAWAHFASSPQVTYGEVADKFGCNRTYIAKHARAHGWREERDRLMAEAAVMASDTIVKTLAERMQDTVKVADGLRSIAIEGMDKIAPKDAAAMIPAYAKLERLFEGESTDNVLHAIPKLDVSLLTDEEVDQLVYLLSKARGQIAS